MADWIGLDWTGLDWTGLGWAGAEWCVVKGPANLGLSWRIVAVAGMLCGVPHDKLGAISGLMSQVCSCCRAD